MKVSMKRERTRKYIYRCLFYVVAMIVLAYGLTLNTKSGLGVSPIISVAFCVSQLTHLNFGDMTLIWYCIFVMGEIVIHFLQKKKKQQLFLDALQFPISLIVTRFINLFVAITPDFAADYPGTFWGGVAGRMVILLIAIVITGIGAGTLLAMIGVGRVIAVWNHFTKKPIGRITGTEE